ncbi:predicted protein, partial [Nematostella vectensis]
CARIKINVSGMVFETYEETLAQYPQTLLGCPQKRVRYLDPNSGEYCFDRDKSLFNSILFFYQSHGILACPGDVSKELFLKEVKFFQLHQAVEKLKKDLEPIVEPPQPILLPDHAIKRKLWLLFEFPHSSRCASFLANFSVFVIVVSTVTFCMETIESIGYNFTNICDSVTNNTNSALNKSFIEVKNATQSNCIIKGEQVEFWSTIEAVYVTWFTLEYLIRVICAPVRCKFMKSAMGLVDFLAIIPFYITLLAQNNIIAGFPVLRIVRLFRVIRVLKLSRYSRGLKLLAKTLVLSGGDLPSILAVLIINIILFSSIVYYVENGIKDSDFKSIPDAFWWSVVTMTTVGYGDQVPKGPLGRLVGAICAVSGIVILFCFPTPVLLSHFEEMY